MNIGIGVGVTTACTRVFASCLCLKLDGKSETIVLRTIWNSLFKLCAFMYYKTQNLAKNLLCCIKNVTIPCSYKTNM